MTTRDKVVAAVCVGRRVYGKAAGTRKDDGEQIGDRTVEITALERRITLHRTLKGHEFNLNALFLEVSLLFRNNERD